MIRNQPVHAIRDAIAARQAIRWYALRHDAFSEHEHVHQLAEEIAAAEDCHNVALLLLRAYRAEIDDPEPQP